MKYGEKKGQGYEDIPQPLAVDSLHELTSQPLLNYLVALSYERDKVDFSQDHVRVAVYEDLLTQVYDRVWSPEDGNVHLQGLSYDDFTALLEQVALAAWHGGDTRQAKLGAITKRLEKTGLSECLESLATRSNDGLLRLLAAFYLGVSGTKLDDPDTDVEFTHKSFGDYLVARHIVGFLELMQGERDRRTRGPRGSGWDDEKSLDEWVERFGPSAMNFDLLHWTTDTVGYREKYPNEEKGQATGIAATWQKTIALLLSDVLHKGVPMERVDPRPSYKEEDRQARNIEESFLTILHCCAQTSGERSDIQWPQENFRHAAWLARLQGHQKLDVFQWLQDATITFLNLSYASLSGFSLGRARLHKADMHEADLRGTDLGESDLEDANLEGANLHIAKLSSAILRGANLRGASLHGANLDNADIRGTDLREATGLMDVYNWQSVVGFDEAIFDPEVRLLLEDIRALSIRFEEEKIKKIICRLEEKSS